MIEFDIWSLSLTTVAVDLNQGHERMSGLVRVLYKPVKPSL